MVATQSYDLLGVDPELIGDASQRADHLFAREGLVAGRNGSMGCEDYPLPGGLQRSLDGRSARHLAARQLERHERSVTLVQVHERRLDPHRVERAHAAYAKQRVLR